MKQPSYLGSPDDEQAKDRTQRRDNFETKHEKISMHSIILPFISDLLPFAFVIIMTLITK